MTAVVDSAKRFEAIMNTAVWSFAVTAAEKVEPAD